MAAWAQDAAGTAVADQWRNLLICSAMYPWWAPAASFAKFCILIVLLCLFFQLLRRHGGTALFKSMGNSFVQGKIWDHPPKMSQKWQNFGVGSSYGTNKPPSGKPSFPYETQIPARLMGAKEGRTVMDFSRGAPWKGLGSIKRPCRELTSLRKLIPPSMCGRELTTYINHLSL